MPKWFNVPRKGAVARQPAGLKDGKAVGGQEFAQGLGSQQRNEILGRAAGIPGAERHEE